MHKSAEIKQLLATHNLRSTRARSLILGLLLHENRHYTPDEMLAELKNQGKPLSTATLYQNLRQLTDKGILAKFSGKNSVLRYDINTEEHNHIVCTDCGRVLDVNLEGSLDHLIPKPLPDTKSDLAQWLVATKHLEFKGVCPDCQKV